MRKIHTVLRLHFEAGLNRRQIAKSLSISYGTVSQIFIIRRKVGSSRSTAVRTHDWYASMRVTSEIYVNGKLWLFVVCNSRYLSLELTRSMWLCTTRHLPSGKTCPTPTPPVGIAQRKDVLHVNRRNCQAATPIDIAKRWHQFVL